MVIWSGQYPRFGVMNLMNRAEDYGTYRVFINHRRVHNSKPVSYNKHMTVLVPYDQIPTDRFEISGCISSVI